MSETGTFQNSYASERYSERGAKAERRGKSADALEDCSSTSPQLGRSGRQSEKVGEVAHLPRRRPLGAGT